MNSFRRNVKRRTDTYRLAIATWCAAGDFAAVQQHRVGFHFRRVDLHTLAGCRNIGWGVLIRCLACVMVLKLPPGDRRKVFEKKDFITFFLLAPGMALLCAVLSLGRLDWWFEAPWIGWALALSLVLIVSAIVFEHNRNNPLLNTRWLSSGSIVRLGLIMLLIRIVLAEQNTGVIGWLQYVGLQNEQMTHLA